MTETPSPEASYRIQTWDTYLNEFTPQDGIPEIVTGFRGLLSALRLLKQHGYPANRDAYGSDPSVLIERISPESE